MFGNKPAKGHWLVVEEKTVADLDLSTMPRFRYLSDDRGNLVDDREQAKVFHSLQEANAAAKAHGLRAIAVD